MKLILLYGPPAAGKLTVAKELSNQTGITLFDNHQTIDFARNLYAEKGPKRGELINTLRAAVFEWAAKQDVDLIFTVVYAKEIDEKWFEDIIEPIENLGGQVCPVQLSPPPEILYERLTTPSRQASESKLTDKEELMKTMDRFDLYEPMPVTNNLIIDNSSLEPSEVAKQIIEHFDLT